MQPGRAAEARGAEGAGEPLSRAGRRSSADGGAAEPLPSCQESAGGGTKVGGSRGCPCRRDQGLSSGRAEGRMPAGGPAPRRPQKFWLPGGSRARRCRRRPGAQGEPRARRAPPEPLARPAGCRSAHLGNPCPAGGRCERRGEPGRPRARSAAGHRAVAAAPGTPHRHRERGMPQRPRPGRGHRGDRDGNGGAAAGQRRRWQTRTAARAVIPDIPTNQGGASRDSRGYSLSFLPRCLDVK